MRNTTNLLTAEFANPRLAQPLKSDNQKNVTKEKSLASTQGQFRHWDMGQREKGRGKQYSAKQFRHWDVKPLKQLGQNFLINKKINEEIVKAGEVGSEDTVLEIGPGTGLLTEYLAKTGADLITVEKDWRLVPILQDKFKNQKNVTIINEDILKLRLNGKSAAHLALDPRLVARDSDSNSLAPHFVGPPPRVGTFDDQFSGKYAADLLGIKIRKFHYKIVGNIPYYLTSHLLKKILTEWPEPKLVLFIVQKEVAKRITARPPEMNPVRSPARDKVASPEDLGKATSYGMNLLGLSVQLYAEAKIIKHVSKENFYPVPKVDSALIKILPKEQTPAEKSCIEKILKLARLAFQGKRKQILNSLSSGLKIPRVALGKKLDEAGIDSKRRPETLTLHEWVKLNQILS